MMKIRGNEQLREKEVYPWLSLLITIILLRSLSLAAFSPRIRNRIKERANGRCEDCGKPMPACELVAGHLVHGKTRHYDKEENGVARCLACEARYHLAYADDPACIGMSKKNNDPIVYGHVLELDEEYRQILIGTYSAEWQGVLHRLGK